LLNSTPKSNPAIGLNFPPDRLFDHRQAPVALEIGTLTQHLLLEITRGFHRPRSEKPCALDFVFGFNDL
jgi:hypothetical protein